MNKHLTLKVILLAQLVQGLSFAGAVIPDLPLKDKEELDGSESETKHRKTGDDDEELVEEEDLVWEFLQAVHGGDRARAQELLATYPDGARALLAATYADHPLEVEACQGREAAVAVLLDLATVNAELEALLIADPRANTRRRTALHHAVEQGHFRVVELLLASSFADRFYVFQDDLMPLTCNQLLMGNLVPTLPKHAAPFAQRVLMRRLIMHHRPDFAEVDVRSALAPLEVAFLDADMPRLRQLLMEGMHVNAPVLRAMLFELKRMKTAEEFYEFVTNHKDFMNQFAELTREVENGTFAEAMLNAHLGEFPDAPPELLGHLVRNAGIRLAAVERTVAEIDAMWNEMAQNYRLSQIRRFNQAAPAAVVTATSVVIALILRSTSPRH